MTEEEIKEGVTGYYGLPTAREVALDLITMLPDTVKHIQTEETYKTSEIIKGLEVEQYFHAVDVPKIM